MQANIKTFHFRLNQNPSFMARQIVEEVGYMKNIQKFLHSIWLCVHAQWISFFHCRSIDTMSRTISGRVHSSKGRQGVGQQGERAQEAGNRMLHLSYLYCNVGDVKHISISKMRDELHSLHIFMSLPIPMIADHNHRADDHHSHWGITHEEAKVRARKGQGGGNR